MTTLIYTLTFVVLISGTALYLTRNHWVPLMPGADYIYYSSLPLSSNTFSEDLESGLSSSNFDLTSNIASNDSRAGLDDAAKNEILKIMKKKRMQFDQARKVYMEQRFAANGIGADGRPKDPKFVSFS
ncbi:hypothetical protein QBC38DRAFT_450611 [Podospora fimiseda]|uniref:Uncharacterized protein n=1 Tax=Podospora fimiseda TaxID=252190 RepID=A0AAN7H4W3_9PEZI|nr:hypothetical protein QBC38DRAFT_450611 [Podospora fimiseda]